MMELTKKQHYKNRMDLLKAEFDQNWKPHYTDIVNYIMPRRGRFLDNDINPNDGAKKHPITLIDDIAEWAVGVQASGMHGGLTSPTRPWFKIGLKDKELMEFGPVKEWLEQVRDIMMKVFHKSNFYPSVHFGYSELGGFGTNAMLVESDYNSVIRCYPFTIGQYYLATDGLHRADTFYRVFWMTARNVVKTFGQDKVSNKIKLLFDKSMGDSWVQIAHVIEPNKERKLDKSDNGNMAFVSAYYEYKTGEEEAFLRESGYKSFPVMAPRWEVIGSNVYGDSPGMRALGNVKMLQKMHEKSLKALDKMIDPPMNAPSSMKTQAATIISGGINYVDTQQGQQGFTPTFQVNPNFQDMEYKINATQEAIKRAFFVDLFLLLSSGDQSREQTAFEVAKKYEEKLQVLGPVIERVQSELLDRVIDRTYEIMFDMDMVPPPPPELENREFEVEYISILAQAQKMVGVTSIEQTVSFVGNIAAVQPNILDKLDTDEAVDQYANIVGVPSKIIRPDDKVAEIRAARAQAEQAALQAEQAAQAVQGAKTLSETDLGGNNALKALIGGQA